MAARPETRGVEMDCEMERAKREHDAAKDTEWWSEISNTDNEEGV